MNSPLVSVIMPVFNAEKHLQEAITSILNQSYPHFEFIVIDDGSVDSSLQIIQDIKDSRMVVLLNEKNSGIVYTLNKGIAKAKGKYIARMDADDIACYNRLEKQVRFLEQNSRVGVLGSNVKYFGEMEAVTDLPLSSNEIKAELLFQSPFIHPSVMIRTELFSDFSYDAKYKHMEDFYLWFRLVPKTDFANLQEVLLHYREHALGVSKLNSFKDSPYLKELYREILSKVVSSLSDKEIESHMYTKLNFNENAIEDYLLFAEWFKKLKKAIKNQDLFPREESLVTIRKHQERFFLRLAKRNKKYAIKFAFNSGMRLKIKHLYYLFRVRPKKS